jgi:hypothetical protein
LLARVLFQEQSLTDDEIVKIIKKKEMLLKHLDLLCLIDAFTLHMNEGIPLKELKKLKQDLKIYMQDCMLGRFCFKKVLKQVILNLQMVGN